MFLTRISINHPVFATMMMVVILVFGAFSYHRLGVDQFPDVDVPVVVVTTTYPGATPEAVEMDVTKPIEEALNTIGGIEEITSTSYEGRSVVVAGFRLEVQSPVAAQDVRETLAALEAELPEEADKPVVSRFNPSDEPILSIVATSRSLGVAELTDLVEERIIRELATVPGVGQTILVSGQKQQVAILVDATRLNALDVTVDDVIQAIKVSNRNRPAGSLITELSEQSIQIQGRVADPKEFLDLIVARRGGAPVYLSNVASVKTGPADPVSRAFYNGEAGLAIDLIKIRDANTVQVAAEVRDRVNQLATVLAPEDVQLEIIRDASGPIMDSLDEVQSTLIEGAALAVAIVFLFLNSWRSTVITALTLPISMIGTLAVIDLLGFTLNMLSLLALTLSIGILVDDAIVVRENITRHLHMGKSHFKAALDGTTEIGLAVIATTATIVAVFLPVAFMDGMAGRFFYEFGVTVSAAVMISLFVAFTLDPMLSSIWHDPAAAPNAVRGAIGRALARFDDGLETVVAVYRELIRWTLRFRLVTLLLTTAVFMASIVMVPLVGIEFIGASDEGEFQISLTAPAGSSLQYTAAKLHQVEAVLRAFPEVASIYSTINTAANPGKHNATLLVGLVPQENRQLTPLALADPIRERLAMIPGIEIAFIQAGLGGGARPIQLSVLGDDRVVLEKAAKDLIASMRQIPGVVDVNSSTSDGSSIFSVRLKPEQASDLGIGLGELSAMLSPLVGGEKVGNWADQLGQTYDVVVRLPEDQRESVSAIGDLLIKPPDRGNSASRPVKLAQIADIELAPAASEIRRLDQQREVLISADISGRTIGDVTTDLEAVMLRALIMAVIFIYVVLASQFGSFLQPLAIMAALPLSLIGVLAGLLLCGSTINMFSMIGFIMLMGLVTKNGILLVDFANREQQRGLSVAEAVVNAGAVRFRPIVMTTLAMIFGMIPLALATSGTGAQRAPMAHAVIGGLLSSTVLTLIVVPVIISCIDSFVRRVKNRSRHISADDPQAAR